MSPGFWPIRALAPAVFCVCLLACMRGYTQGQGNMTPTAVSQVLEALLKLAIGLPLAWYVLRIGHEPGDGRRRGHPGRHGGHGGVGVLRTQQCVHADAQRRSQRLQIVQPGQGGILLPLAQRLALTPIFSASASWLSPCALRAFWIFCPSVIRSPSFLFFLT